MVGSVVFIDGGTDAYFRANDWPAAVPLCRVPGYLWRQYRSQKTHPRDQVETST